MNLPVVVHSNVVQIVPLMCACFIMQFLDKAIYNVRLFVVSSSRR
jgi:hypothetical protein